MKVVMDNPFYDSQKNCRKIWCRYSNDEDIMSTCMKGKIICYN